MATTARQRCGFTLVEILVAIAVLVTIAAIIAPVIVRSKDAARGANDISNLRQLGLAAALYLDTYGKPPSGCPTVVEARLAPEALCAGLLDPYREGLANRLVKGLGSGIEAYEVTYRSTFVGRREFGWPEDKWEEAMNHAESIGWLVDLAPSDNLPETEPSDCQWRGRYRRLMLDSSVQWRAHKRVLVSPSGPERWSPVMLFGDFDDEWIRTASRSE